MLADFSSSPSEWPCSSGLACFKTRVKTASGWAGSDRSLELRAWATRAAHTVLVVLAGLALGSCGSDNRCFPVRYLDGQTGEVCTHEEAPPSGCETPDCLGQHGIDLPPEPRPHPLELKP
jgi:hypothetical protein